MAVAVVKRKSKWKKIGKVAVFMAVIAMAAFIGFYYWTGIPAAAATYKKNKQLAEQGGLPFTLAEFKKRVDVPPEQNGASILADNPPPNVSILDDGTTGPGFEEARPKIIATIPKLQKVLDYKYIQIPEDFLSPFLPKELTITRQWIQILVYLAAEQVRVYNFKAATKHLDLAVFLANHAGDSQTFRGFLFRRNCTGLVLNGLRHLVPVVASQPEGLNLIAKEAWDLDRPFELHQVVSSDHVSLILQFDDIYQKARWWEQFGIDGGIDPALRTGPFLPRFREANLSRIHEYFAKLNHELPADPWDFDSLDRAFSASKPIIENGAWSSTFCNWVGMIRSHSVKGIRSISANKNALLQAVTILQRHLDPAKGLPLLGRYRFDVDGNPIRIKKFPKGWEVYSIGADGKDDGGRDALIPPHDIVVHLSIGTVPVKPKPAAKDLPRKGIAPPWPSPKKD